jgi:signal peptidase II
MNSTSLKWLWLSALVLVLDQISKYYIAQSFTLYESIQLFPGLNFTYVHNTGAAFSFLSDAGGWQRWLFIVLSSGVSIRLILWIKSLPVTWRWLAAALALVLGGAIGNLVDRVLYGYVIDFIDVYYQGWHWPAFNIADSAISIGVVMLIIDTFWFDNASMGRHNGDVKK